jgi:hypothetical protein
MNPSASLAREKIPSFAMNRTWAVTLETLHRNAMMLWDIFNIFICSSKNVWKSESCSCVRVRLRSNSWNRQKKEGGSNKKHCKIKISTVEVKVRQLTSVLEKARSRSMFRRPWTSGGTAVPIKQAGGPTPQKFWTVIREKFRSPWL